MAQPTDSPVAAARALAATQHMLVGPGTWELTGRALLGLDLDDSQL